MVTDPDKRIARNTVLLVALIVLVLMALSWTWRALDGAYTLAGALSCRSSLQRSIRSPDNSKTATETILECSAVDPDYTTVCVALTESLDPIETCDPILVVEGRHKLVQEWIDDRTLLLDIPANEQIVTRADERDGVNLKYTHSEHQGEAPQAER